MKIRSCFMQINAENHKISLATVCSITSGEDSLAEHSVHGIIIYWCEWHPLVWRAHQCGYKKHTDMVRNSSLVLLSPVSSLSHSHFSHTFRESNLWDLRRKSCYLSSRGKVWSVYSWSGTSLTAVKEALIEEIRTDGVIGEGMRICGIWSVK